MAIERVVKKFDADNKIAGRLASQAAILLQGKHKVSYRPHIDGGDFVQIVNVDRLKFSGKKLDSKIYYRNTGYPGGIRTTSLRERVEKRPDELFRDMVYAMLPKNKLRPMMIKRLTFIKAKKS